MADYNLTLAAEDHASEIMRHVGAEITQLANVSGAQAKEMEKSNEEVGLSFSSLISVVTGIAGAYASILSVRRITRFSREAAEAFNVQEQAADGLRSALASQATALETVAEARGNLGANATQMQVEAEAARLATERHAQFASELQSMTAVGDEVTLGIQRRAALLGVESAQLDTVAAAAIGVSEATGLGINEALRKVNEAINGNAGALGEYLPALKAMQTEEEKLAAVSELANRGLSQKTDSLSRLDGAQERARGLMGDLKESVGQLLEPFLVVSNEGIAYFAKTAITALGPAVDFMQARMEDLAGATSFAAKIAVGSVTAIEIGFTHFNEVAVYAVSAVQLAMVKLTENIRHYFGEAIGVVEWFGTHFTEIMVAASNVIITVVSNLASKVGEILSVMTDFVLSGFEGGLDNFAGRIGNVIGDGLLNGLNISIAKLPEIAGREITQRERQLEELMGSVGSNLGDAFSEKFAERMKAIEAELSKDRKINLDLQANAAKLGEEQAKAIDGALKGANTRLLTRGDNEDPLNSIASTSASIDKSAKQIAKNTQPQKQVSQPPLNVKVHAA